MLLAVLTLELDVLGAQSLKERRTVVQSLLGRIRSRFNVAAAQVDDSGLWQRATLACAVLGDDGTVLEGVLNRVRDLVDQDPRCDVMGCRLEFR